MSELKEYDLPDVEWREYDFNGRVYKIDKPIKLWIRPGGETHRVQDSTGVVHCVPAPGHYGCVLRWKKFSATDNPSRF